MIHFLIFKDKSISEKTEFSKIEKIDLQDSNLIEEIKKNYEPMSDGYIYEISDNETVFYNDELKNIRFSLSDSSKILERWIYQINLDILEYQNYDKNISFIYTNNQINCIKGVCNDAENIVLKFFQTLSKTLK